MTNSTKGYKETQEDKDNRSLLIVFLIVAVGVIIAWALMNYYVFAPQQKLIDQLKIDIQKSIDETNAEKLRLKTIVCSELKIAIGNNEFVHLTHEANNQYLGRCT